MAVAETENDQALSDGYSCQECLRATSSQKKTQWRPLSLRPAGLIFYGTVLACILIALVVIWRYSIAHRGFTLITTNHYIWTLGPTAVFIVVISYWRLVDYHSKALSAWAELSKRPSSANRTLLLDYVSPLLPTTFWLASKTGHYAVCLSILGFVIFQIITIASTGLFLRETILVGPFERGMAQTSQFDTRTNFSLEEYDPGASPFYQAYATMQLGLPLADGLTHELLYETYTPVAGEAKANATYLVQSRAFAPMVKCELMNVSALIDSDDFEGSGPNFYIPLQVHNTSSWTCPSREIDGDLQITNVAHRLAPPRQLLSSFETRNCKSKDQIVADTGPFLVALTDVRTKQSFNVSTADINVGDLIDPVTWSVSVRKTTGVLCTIDYNMLDVHVMYNTSLSNNQVQSVSPIGVSGQSVLPLVSINYLTNKLRYASFIANGGATFMFGYDLQGIYTEEPTNTVLTMVAKRANTTLKGLVDRPKVFKQATEDVLTNMVLQIAQQALIVPSSNSTFIPQQALSQVYYHEDRLVMQWTSALIVVVGIALLIMLTPAIYLLRPDSSLSANPESLSTQAAVLEASGALNKTLQGLATSSEKSTKAAIGEARYQITSDGLTIRACSKDEIAIPKSTNNPSSVGKKTGYSPFTLSKIFLGMALISPLIVIGILEGFQRSSDSGTPGIATISTNNTFVISLYSRFLPAVVALIVATMYNSLESQTILLAPYGRLVSDRGSFQDFGTPLSAYIAPKAIWMALRRRYWSASLTSMAALVGSVLTIVVSGLYTVDSVPLQQDMVFSQADSFNMSFVQGHQTDGGAAAISSLIESANLSYPLSTYDEMVFPGLSLNSTGSSGTVSLVAPALRADLSCDELPWELSNTSWGTYAYKNSTPSTTVNFNITVPLPETCHFGSCFGNESFIRPYVSGQGISLGPDNVTYYGTVLDLHTGPVRAPPGDDTCLTQFNAAGDASENQHINQPGCPSLLVAYGYFEGQDRSKSTWTTLVCKQRVQKVNTSIELGLPDLNILQEPKPTPDESTAEYIGKDSEKTFGWWLSTSIDNSLAMFNKSAIDPVLLDQSGGTSGSATVADNFYFSNFFRAAFFGRTPLPLEMLKRNDTEARAEVLDHLNMFYRRYMAQYISANLRVQPQSSSISQLAKREDAIISGPPLTGSFTPDIGVPRLIQHRTPKVILQVLLAFMFVCAVAALSMGWHHDLVPWNPCTIAGVMVLFGGSKMCGGKSIESATQDPQYCPGTVLVANNRRGSSADIGEHEMVELMSTDSRPRQQLLDSSSRASLAPSEMSVEGLRRRGNARFRLGWWQNGVYMGQMKGKGMVREGGGWRYGIDVI